MTTTTSVRPKSSADWIAIEQATFFPNRRPPMVIERGQGRNLPAEALESLPHHLTQVVRHLDVSAPNLYPHERLLVVSFRSYARYPLRARGNGQFATPHRYP